MAPAVYGWRLKRSLMSVTNIMHQVTAAVDKGDPVAMKVLRFYHLGLTQMHELDGNSSDHAQLHREVEAHKAALAAADPLALAAEPNFPITPQQRATAQKAAEAGVPLSEILPNKRAIRPGRGARGMPGHPAHQRRAGPREPRHLHAKARRAHRHRRHGPRTPAPPRGAAATAARR